MKFKKLIHKSGKKKFIIEEDYPEVGAYLYVYDGKKCIYDSLQDNLELCKEFAFDKFSVPIDKWEKI